MYRNNFWQPTVHLQQNVFDKTLIEFVRSHLCASFGTFCVQIGQLFAAQWVFKHLKEFRNWRHFPSITAFCRFSNIFQRLTVPRICDQFGCKRCPKKHRDVNYKLLYEFFKISLFCLNGRLSKVRSVHTYVITRTVYFDWICT